MQTIKTGAIVIVLLGVLYCAYSFFTTPEGTPPPEVAEHLRAFENGEDFELEIDMGDDESGAGFPQPIPDREGTATNSVVPPDPTAPYSTGDQNQTTEGDNPAVSAPVRPPVASSADLDGPSTGQGGDSTDNSIPRPTIPDTTGAARNSDFNPNGNSDTSKLPNNTGVGSTDAKKLPAIGGSEDSGSNVATNNTDADSEVERFRKNGLDLVKNPTLRDSDTAKARIVEEDDTIFRNAQIRADEHIDKGKPREALARLSAFYNSSDLSAEEHRDLLRRLDQLAGQVVYSREHHLAKAYVVRRYDKLSTIAANYNVPEELLQNINGVENPDAMVPGRTLKVVPGPFRAEIDLKRKELTLFVQNLYAGRFAITVGGDPSPSPGKYSVRAKEFNRQYVPASGPTIPGGHPTNPYGNYWLDLGSQMSLHGSPDRSDNARFGCISLSPIDAKDIYGILSKGSIVKIMR